MKVYGVSVSYYTGKLEAYLRYKGIAYEFESPFADAKRIKQQTGAIQVPMVLRDDGRWMSDSTPIIRQLEGEYPARPVMPADPTVRFIALLIEDYADEWLWRAAMHYRWSYEHDRALLSRILVDEVTQHIRVPRFMKLRRISKRQRTGFVTKDGVTEATREHVEAGYFTALRLMSAMLQERPYLLGTTPSIADFGMMGPMFRHFAQDPTPQEIMRKQGPAVFEWVTRMWNAGATAGEPDFVNNVPASAVPLLKEIEETHLQQLTANAEAYASGQQHFDMTVQGCRYRHLPVSRYRVHCLERLRDEYAALSAIDQDKVRSLLVSPQASVLWQAESPARSGYDEARQAPFNKAINVFGDGVPQ